MTLSEIEADVRRFLIEEFLLEDDGELTRSTPLISGGILDSIARLKLVSYLEGQYGIEIQAHEAHEESMDTIELIAKLVASKLNR